MAQMLLTFGVAFFIGSLMRSTVDDMRAETARLCARQTYMVKLESGPRVFVRSVEELHQARAADRELQDLVAWAELAEERMRP